MKNDAIIAGLDVGAHSIKCVVAELKADDTVEILGTGCQPCAGIREGLVHDRDLLAQAIQKTVDEAGLMAGCEIGSVWVAVSGSRMTGRKSTGLSRITGGRVNAQHVEQALDLAQAVKLPPEHAIMHVIPRGYSIDEGGFVAAPHGMPGVRLEVDAHLIVGHTALTAEIEASCAQAGIAVEDFVYAPLAAAEFLLKPEDRELGVVLLDIGGSTTHVAVFKEGGLLHTSNIPVGGEHVTSDVRDCLHTPTVEAERLKRDWGCAMTSLIEPQAEIEIPGAGGRRPRVVKQAMLCEIIEARVAEILAIVADDLASGGFVDGLPGGVVLTGGGADMKGVVELTEDVLGMQTSAGAPHAITGLVDVVRNPRYATGSGLVKCGTLTTPKWVNPRRQIQTPSWWQKTRQNLRKLWGGGYSESR
ncbi:MAG: cell division protein FtsA [Bradymonadia bacterium]